MTEKLRQEFRRWYAGKMAEKGRAGLLTQLTEAREEVERLTAALAAAETEQLERLANWAISLSLPTGHADTTDDLLAEVGGGVRELQERANDLTAERDAALKLLVRAYTQGYMRGHNDTVEGGYVDVLPCDEDSYFAEDVADWKQEVKP